MIISYIFFALVGIYTLTAAVLDFRLHKIPNYLTVPTAVTGLVFHMLAPGGWGAVASLSGFAIGFLLLLVPWFLGGSGMGDVKLLAALGAWLGPKLIFVAFGVSIGCAALLAAGMLAYGAITRGSTESQRKHLNRSRTSGAVCLQPVRLLPFAVPVAMSTWLVLVWAFSRNLF